MFKYLLQVLPGSSSFIFLYMEDLKQKEAVFTFILLSFIMLFVFMVVIYNSSPATGLNYYG